MFSKLRTELHRPVSPYYYFTFRLGWEDINNRVVRRWIMHYPSALEPKVNFWYIKIGLLSTAKSLLVLLVNIDPVSRTIVTFNQYYWSRPFFWFNRSRFWLKRILPHLNYGDIVWGDQLGLKLEVDNIEAFQDRFAKRWSVTRCHRLRHSRVGPTSNFSCGRTKRSGLILVNSDEKTVQRSSCGQTSIFSR